MNNTETDRGSIWVTVIGIMALFRILLIPSTFIASVIDMLLGKSWLIVAQQLRFSLAVLTPVITVGLAVSAFCKLQTHLQGLPKGKRLFVFTVLAIVALIPWQPEVAVRMTPVGFDQWQQMQNAEIHKVDGD